MLFDEFGINIFEIPTSIKLKNIYSTEIKGLFEETKRLQLD